MTRSWIEFVQSQNLPWQSDALAGFRPGVEMKILSKDDQTGALSCVMRYPPDFHLPTVAMSVDNELLVLSGELQIGEYRHGPFGYAHLPSGFCARTHWQSPRGAMVLEFFSGHPETVPTSYSFDAERLVIGLDGMSAPYTGNFHPEFPLGAGRKILYSDPDTNDTTWLLGTLPLRWGERSEVHPTVEEMFLLAGEVHGNRGIMRPGAYVWRPANEPHGPYGTLTGNLFFFRAKGGGLSTKYVEPEDAFHWWPSYSPVLPPTLECYAWEAPERPNEW